MLFLSPYIIKTEDFLKDKWVFHTFLQKNSFLKNVIFNKKFRGYKLYLILYYICTFLNFIINLIKTYIIEMGFKGFSSGRSKKKLKFL